MAAVVSAAAAAVRTTASRDVPGLIVLSSGRVSCQYSVSMRRSPCGEAEPSGRLGVRCIDSGDAAPKGDPVPASNEKRQKFIVETLIEAFEPLMKADAESFRTKFRKMAADPFAFYRGSACL